MLPTRLCVYFWQMCQVSVFNTWFVYFTLSKDTVTLSVKKKNNLQNLNNMNGTDACTHTLVIHSMLEMVK